MYTLHIANKNYSSWSLRPWVLMKELAIPFEEKVTPFGTGSNWNSFRQFSPTGLVPCLEDGEQAVWDSLAIIEYLAEQHPQVWPSDVSARTWARCAAAEMHSGFFALRNQCPMNCAITVKLKTVNEVLQKDINRLDELWNQGFERFGGSFLAGNRFTAVDAFYAPVAFRVRSFGIALSEAAQDYVDLLLSLDSLKQWAVDAINETWREEGHERECLEAGEITSDLRS